VLSYLDRQPVRAPIDGVARGIVRDGLDVPAYVKLLEIGPRGRHALWTGVDERGRRIAEATVRAIRIKVMPLTAAVKRGATLLH
jgi:xanthine dehydrogenase accessory factor